MKVSEWLREYQITGIVPDHKGEHPMLSFWAGFLIGNQGKVHATTEQRIAAAMLFFRQPVGNEALDELHRIIGPDATQAMMYVGGVSTTNPSPETWAAVAGIGHQQ